MGAERREAVGADPHDDIDGRSIAAARGRCPISPPQAHWHATRFGAHAASPTTGQRAPPLALARGHPRAALLTRRRPPVGVWTSPITVWYVSLRI